jgi:hypothetical protein
VSRFEALASSRLNAAVLAECCFCGRPVVALACTAYAEPGWKLWILCGPVGDLVRLIDFDDVVALPTYDYCLVMFCGFLPSACALQDIARALQAGPSLFEWLALVIVPALVALATIFIAWRSVSIAKESGEVSRRSLQVAERSNELAEASHRLSEEMLTDARKAEARRERDLFATEATAWMTLEVEALVNERNDRDYLVDRPFIQAQEARVNAQAGAMGEQDGFTILIRLRKLIEDAGNEGKDTDVSVWMTLRYEAILRSWQQDPSLEVLFGEDAC